MTTLRLALAAALLLPTAPAPQQPSAPTIKVDTKLTVVDVTVTDKYGRPVHGLKSEDFVVKEDGKPQPIKNFDEYGGAAPTIPVGPKLPPGIYTNQPTTQPTASASNILLFDDINTGLNLLAKPELFLYAQHQAAAYLKTLPPGTRVAIMTAGDQLRLVQDFTTDKDVLLAAIGHLIYSAASGTTISDVDLLRNPDLLLPLVCTTANRRSHLTMDSLRQLSAFTAGIRGRKNVVWFTPGIPWLTNYGRFSAVRCLDNLTPQLNQTYGMLTSARAALYTADSNGLQVAEDMTGMGLEWAYMAPPPTEFETRMLDRESLQDFADATGGKAFYNRNDLDAATGEAIASGSDYYAISYTPPLAGYDGKYHSISVKVNRPGVQLTYRKGYTSMDLAKLSNSIDRDKLNKTDNSLPPAVSKFRAEMGHGAISSSELLLAARIMPVATPVQAASPPVKGLLNPKIKPDPLVRYDVIYSLPAGQVTLSENPDGTRKGSVEFDIVAYGEDGTKLNVVRQTANIQLKPEDVADFQQKPFEVPLQFDLPPGKLFVRIGVLDVLSGKAGTLEVPQTVAKP